MGGLFAPHRFAAEKASNCVSTRKKIPLQEYKREAFNMFNQLLRSIQAESIQHIFRAQPQMSEMQNVFEIPPEMLARQYARRHVSQDDFFAMLQNLMDQQMAGGPKMIRKQLAHRAYLHRANARKRSRARSSSSFELAAAAHDLDPAS